MIYENILEEFENYINEKKLFQEKFNLSNLNPFAKVFQTGEIIGEGKSRWQIKEFAVDSLNLINQDYPKRIRPLPYELIFEYIKYLLENQNPNEDAMREVLKESADANFDKFLYGYHATLKLFALEYINRKQNSGIENHSEKLFSKADEKIIEVPQPLILYGPPGTGKTYKMQHEYIDKFAKEDRFITTFHQSFSYEEFVEGLKPVLADKPDGEKSSDVKYKIEKGIFYKACERAAELAGYESKKDESETPLQKCIADVDRSTKMDEAIKENKIVLLCIDEINRANVSAVFGDLISLIEPSKRIGAKNEMVVSLPYSKEDFAVPANLMIVGTMNTADRSIQLLDSALRRRFRFEELLPDYEKIENATAKEILQKINARIRCLLDKDHQIGHSYFIEAKNDLDIFNALKDSVIPLLEEYFYNDAQKIRQILNENDNTDNVFYVKDEEAENASRLIQNDYDDEKTFYQLNPKLSEVKDEDSAASFISHIAPKAD